MTDNNLLAVEIILPSRQINSNDNGINASNAAKTQEVLHTGLRSIMLNRIPGTLGSKKPKTVVNNNFPIIKITMQSNAIQAAFKR